MIDLTRPDLTKLPTGELVKTTKGFIWEVIGAGLWKDQTTGLTWGPIHKEKLNHYQATEKYRDKLPIREEFEEAEKHGIREVLNMNGYWFWSSSVSPDDTDYAYVFYGNFGDIYYAYRGGSSIVDAVVCVQGR
jgi:hypothetical protein